MSHFLFDEDTYEPVYESRPCTACNGDMKRCNGMCNGMFSAGYRTRSPEEITARRTARIKREEDEILAQADRITAARAFQEPRNSATAL